MKKTQNYLNMNKRILLLISICFYSVLINAQTEEEVKKIISNYDLNKINEKKQELLKEDSKREERVRKFVSQRKLARTIKNEDGSTQELIDVTPDGKPVYISSENTINAAKTTRTNFLHTGGSLGLDLNGEGMVARVWDEGQVRNTHATFSGRTTSIDKGFTRFSGHATHVTSVLLGDVYTSDGNIVEGAKGMAPKATARTFNWSLDEIEMVDEISKGMLLSNHSYGIPVSTRGTNPVIQPAWIIGSYNNESRIWDEITYLAPYYLPVSSAGNGGEDMNNTNPSTIGFDKLTTFKTAKNTLVVANGRYSEIDANGNLVSIEIFSQSSQGPTDDNRIKPDITGNGFSIRAAYSDSDTDTNTLTGTSISSPNVMGSLLLLQQYYNRLYKNYMLAATVKGLACHTADDAGPVGPDPVFGWGVLNSKKAAETITNNGLTSWISEETLKDRETFSFKVKSDGKQPLLASITWTDLPGVANLGDKPINDSTPALVNNLDIKVKKLSDNSFSYPWRLDKDARNPALRNAENNVDNVERVNIDNPTAGEYEIIVTHKGNLVDKKQNFSLIVTGITSSFALVSNVNSLTKCTNDSAVYKFNYKQIGSFTTNFTATNLPVGATATLNPVSLNSDGIITMTISNLSGVTPNEYNIGIKADNGLETETRFNKLVLYSNNFENVANNSPVNNSTTDNVSQVLKWDKYINVTSYKVIVADNSSFTNPIANQEIANNEFTVHNLNGGTTYYWKVIPKNICGEMPNNSVKINNFKTNNINCSIPAFEAKDFSNATIGETFDEKAYLPIVVDSNEIISDLNVELDISHTDIGNLTITLETPFTGDLKNIKFLENVCFRNANENIKVTFDDAGTKPICGAAPSALTGVVSPIQQLQKLNGLSANGTWYLRVTDTYSYNGGKINSAKLKFCTLNKSLENESFNKLSYTTYPNPAKSNLTIDFENDTNSRNIQIVDFQGREVYNKSTNDKQLIIDVKPFSEGVYILRVIENNKIATNKIIVNK